MSLQQSQHCSGGLLNKSNHRSEILNRWDFLLFCSENYIKHDNYLVPYTMYELGLLHKQKGDINAAIALLENAK